MSALRNQRVAPRSLAGSQRQTPGPNRPAGRVRFALAALALACAALALAWGAGRWLRTTPGLAVRRIAFSGVVRADEAALAAASGALGRNALSLDLGQVRARLVADPWIAEATVRRALPHELDVRVVERVPVAVEADSSGARRLVDEEGRVLREGGPADGAGLVAIRGLESVGEADRAGRRALAAATVAALLRKAPELVPRVEAIDASAGDRLVIVASGCPPLWVSGPESADAVAAWSRRERGIGQAVGGAAWVDARWRGRLYVKPSRT